MALELFVDAGLLREAKPGLAYLTGRLLEEGTHSRSAEELAEAIEDVGGTLDVGACGVSLRVRAEDLALAVELLADVALRPAFPAEAIPWAKRRIVAELQGDRDDPAFRADLIFRGLVYGDHPYARDPRGTTRADRPADPRRRPAHHARYFAPDNAFLVAVGDFEPKALHALIRAQFQTWEPRGGGRRRSPGSRGRRGPGSAAWATPASRSTSCSATWGSAATTPTSTPSPCSTTSSAAGRASPTG